jgi:hypothetical protein
LARESRKPWAEAASPRSAVHDSQKTAGYEYAKCGRYTSEDRMWKIVGRRRRERAAHGRWRDRERLGRSPPACYRLATIPSNSPTERQRTTYDTQSPSALVEIDPRNLSLATTIEARAISNTMPHFAHLFTYKIANFKPLHPRHHRYKSFKILIIRKKSNVEVISLILSKNFKFIILLN